MSIRNYHQWHAQQDALCHERRLKLAKEAIELCDRIATPEEIAAAQALLETDPSAPQGDLKLSVKGK